MKRLFILAVIVFVIFSACKEPENQLPYLTIKNESSYVLTDVKFSGISFTSSGKDLLVSAQAVRQLAKNDLNKSGYITFIRKDIGIVLRTELITISDNDFIFTFIDSTGVEEAGNPSNRRALSQITFVSNVVIEKGALNVPRNDNVYLGEGVINFTIQNEFRIKNTGIGDLLLDGTQPIRITGPGADAFTVIQPAAAGGRITPRNSAIFRINFSPTTVQMYNATVTVHSNNQSGNFSFAITATGAAPKPTASVFL